MGKAWRRWGQEPNTQPYPPTILEGSLSSERSTKLQVSTPSRQTRPPTHPTDWWGSQQSLPPGHSLGELESSVKNNIANSKGLARLSWGDEVCPSGKLEVCPLPILSLVAVSKTSQLSSAVHLPHSAVSTAGSLPQSWAQRRHRGPKEKAPIPHPQQSRFGTLPAALENRLNNPGTPPAREGNAQTPLVGKKIIWRKVIPLVYSPSYWTNANDRSLSGHQRLCVSWKCESSLSCGVNQHFWDSMQRCPQNLISSLSYRWISITHGQGWPPQRTVYKEFCAFCIKISLVFREFTLWQIMQPPSQGLHYGRSEGCVGSLLLWAPKTASWRQIWHPKSNNAFHLNIQEMLNFLIHLFLIKNPCNAKQHVSEIYLDYKNCSSY